MRTHVEAPDGTEVTITRAGLLYGFGQNKADAVFRANGIELTAGDLSDGAAPDADAVAAISKGATTAALEFIRGYFVPVVPGP